MGNKLDSDVMWVLHRQERKASLFMTRQTDELTNLTTGRLHKVKERFLCNLRAQINTSQSRNRKWRKQRDWGTLWGCLWKGSNDADVGGQFIYRGAAVRAIVKIVYLSVTSVAYFSGVADISSAIICLPFSLAGERFEESILSDASVNSAPLSVQQKCIRFRVIAPVSFYTTPLTQVVTHPVH